MPLARYEIVSCLSKHLAYVEIEVPKNFNEMDHRHQALAASGFDGRIICEGCHDNSYRAEFIELV